MSARRKNRGAAKKEAPVAEDSSMVLMRDLQTQKLLLLQLDQATDHAEQERLFAELNRRASLLVERATQLTEAAHQAARLASPPAQLSHHERLAGRGLMDILVELRDGPPHAEVQDKLDAARAAMQDIADARMHAASQQPAEWSPPNATEVDVVDKDFKEASPPAFTLKRDFSEFLAEDPLSDAELDRLARERDEELYRALHEEASQQAARDGLEQDVEEDMVLDAE